MYVLAQLKYSEYSKLKGQFNQSTKDFPVAYSTIYTFRLF